MLVVVIRFKQVSSMQLLIARTMYHVSNINVPYDIIDAVHGCFSCVLNYFPLFTFLHYHESSKMELDPANSKLI